MLPPAFLRPVTLGSQPPSFTAKETLSPVRVEVTKHFTTQIISAGTSENSNVSALPTELPQPFGYERDSNPRPLP